MGKNIFDSIKIGLASPEMIRSWSYGEVKKAETINYRTLKPEKDGLFCESIFGPQKDMSCQCGKYKRPRYKGKICEKCHVEVTSKKVRRERMGHIELAAPVSHIWYFRAVPSRIGTLLDIPLRSLEHVLYFAEYIVLDPGNTPLEKNQVLTDTDYKTYYERYGSEFRVGMGAEAIKELLEKLDLDALAKELREELAASNSAQKRTKVIKRLEVVEAFRLSGNKPEWMILTVLPVSPPDIRPMVQLDGGRFATSDLNDLYRRVINRNARLKKLLEMEAPEIIIRNEKRMLQEAVDALIDNGKRGKPVTGPSNRQLKSLSEMLRGKQGRFRQNLLGKRVDYSGRSVIVVGPELRIYQCGLPKEMALELFKPFVMKHLVENGKATNIRDAKRKVERVHDEVWDALEVVIKSHPVLLNRAPTLHRLSIQAFEPVLVEGRAIKLHPLVCSAFNADFDGDQMPVHVPLSAEAQAEARYLMLSANNLLKPVDGRAVAVPSQDMVLGSYYLTMDKAGEPGEGGIYRNFDEAMMAYETGALGIHAPIKVRVSRDIDVKLSDGTTETRHYTAVIDATLGRMIFNQNLPQNMGFKERNPDDAASMLALEIDMKCGKKELGKIIDACIKTQGFAVTADVLDAIKSMGFKYSTIGALSISVYDISVPEQKYALVQEAEQKVLQVEEFYADGMMTDEERHDQIIDIWEKTTDAIVKLLKDDMDPYNPIKMMSDSGARGSMTQMRQLAGIRGLMFATDGSTMEFPIRSNFREGLSILEYFIAARGARKSLSDTALKTADSGYLTRRLVDVSQEVIIREDDCGATEGMYVKAIYGDDPDVPVEKLWERIAGRYIIGGFVDPATGELIAADGDMLTDDQAKRIEATNPADGVQIRSVFKCRAKNGICAHCYGADLATGKRVNIGEAVGIIAAQSIGEPGTQLTMRTFHTGGVAGANITQGLPRVEELFEARRPKKTATIAEIDGTVSFEEGKKARSVVITANDGRTASYQIPWGTKMVVEEGEYVTSGMALTEGSMYPGDILNVSGIAAVYDYIIREIQLVYRSQSVDVNDKHVEVITRQMTRKVQVEDPGDTDLMPEAQIDITTLEAANEKIARRIEAGELDLRPATATPMLLGITKAALRTESFLSAASFQETTKVLTEAAIYGKVDHLLGLKENVIIGKLIPAGTGMPCYSGVSVVPTEGGEPTDETAE